MSEPIVVVEHDGLDATVWVYGHEAADSEGVTDEPLDAETLQARGVISVAERQAYIGRVRDLAKGACAEWLERSA